MKNKITSILLLFLYLSVLGHNALHNAMSKCICCEYNHPFEQCSCPFCSHHTDDVQTETDYEHHSNNECNCICCYFNTERYIPSGNHVDDKQLKSVFAVLMFVKIVNEEDYFCPNITDFDYREVQTRFASGFYPEAFSLRGPPVV